MEDVENEVEGGNTSGISQVEYNQFEIGDDQEDGCLRRFNLYSSYIGLTINERCARFKNAFSQYDNKDKCALLALFIFILLGILAIICIAVLVGAGKSTSQKNIKGNVK